MGNGKHSLVDKHFKPGPHNKGPHQAMGAVRDLLLYIGEDPDRPGLKDTPLRFVKALEEMTSGYTQSVQDVLKVFEDGAERYDEVILVRDIPIHSLCEHHLAPFHGVAHIGYIPNRRAPRIMGLSKFSRVADVFARRLQVQERLTVQIADALDESLKPRGVGVIVQCRHFCMECRGVKKVGAVTVTSAMRGVFRKSALARSEFLALALDK